MGGELVVMNIAVFGAAALQSATGIGFGIVAGPIMLMVLGSGDAIQISIILNILIAGFLMPSVRIHANQGVLMKFLLGSAIGIPVGLYVFLSVDIVLLKALAGIAVLMTVFIVLRKNGRVKTRNTDISENGMAIPVGIVSGVMGGSLGMPGPVPAAWMASTGFSKEAIRGTVLMLFVFSYAAAFMLQISVPGISAETIWTSIYLAPSTIVGILFGKVLAGWLTERGFRWLLVAILVSTAVLLFSSVL